MRVVWTCAVGVALVLVGARGLEATSILLCNTGQPVGCVGTLSDGSTDLNYTIVTAPANTPALTGPTKVVVDDGFPVPGPWGANDANSKWIGPGAADNNSNGPVGDYDYRTTFDLTGLNPATASIAGAWSTDNSSGGIFDILINGIPVGASQPGFPTLTPFSISSGFQNGINILDFIVNNSGGPTGLRVDDLRGTASPVTPVPEPASIMLLGAGLASMVARMRSRTNRTR